MGYIFSTYVMSMGLPFERWVQRLSELAQEESNPQRFLAKAVQHMLDMPWLKGVEWTVPNSQGEVGSRTAHATRVAFGDLTLVIHTRWEPSPAILLHLNLLARMVGHFYDAKRRDQVQRQHAYAHAVYETGARLTHDVKNLLQSLKSLCAAAATTTPEQAPALQALMQRQLPQIAQRLNTALDKLRAPQPIEPTLVGAAEWWDALVQRYMGRNIDFAWNGPQVAATLPAELFDAVADNLIENSLNKSAPARVQIRVLFGPEDGGKLRVCDDGAAISGSVAGQLFEAPVASQTGFGIGLYQSSKLAAQFGYRLALETNRPGAVCFVLAREGASARPVNTRRVA
jgi:signal transduction histidine kinase